MTAFPSLVLPVHKVSKAHVKHRKIADDILHAFAADRNVFDLFFRF